MSKTGEHERKGYECHSEKLLVSPSVPTHPICGHEGTLANVAKQTTWDDLHQGGQNNGVGRCWPKTGQTPRWLPKQPDIQTGTTTDQPPNAMGTRGEGSRRRTPNKPRTNNRTRHRSKLTNKGGGKGKPARPRNDQKHKRRNKDKQKTTETNTEATGKGARRLLSM